MRRLLGWSWLVLALAWGAWIRVDATHADPSYDRVDAVGLLRSDPALLAYLTQRVLDAGGGTPDDFRADPRIQHPDTTDVPAEFAVGEEFLVAWAQRLGGGSRPLHETALGVLSLCAAAIVLGVWLVVRAGTGSELWAALAVALVLVTPANYRTIGFLWVREDLSVPLFALHLGLLVRALRAPAARAALDFGLAGLALAAALATWHAMGSIVALELAVLWVGFLRSGRSPFSAPLPGAPELVVPDEPGETWAGRRPGASWVLAAPALAVLFVPVLRASGAWASPAAALALGLWAPAWLPRRRQGSAPVGTGRMRVRLLGLAVALGGFGLTRPLAPAAHAHVNQVLLAKLLHLGRLPADPAALSFDARLLWQGPFETLELSSLAAWLGWPLVALAGLCVLALLRTREPVPDPAGARARPGSPGGDAPVALLGGLALVSLPAAWLFGRLVVLPGFLLPALSALVLARWPRRSRALAAFLALTLWQAGAFPAFVQEPRSDWNLPPRARTELAELIRYVRANVPADEAVVGDFVNSTALLVHAGCPIVLQPKYETDRSRRKAEAFLTTFFQGSSVELARLVAGPFASRWLLIDRHVLWELSRYTGGLAWSETEPRPGTAAADFLGPAGSDPPARVGDFELVYQGARGVPRADYRLYRLREPR